MSFNLETFWPVTILKKKMLEM